MSVGTILRIARMNSGLTQESVSLDIGVTKQTIMKWESDKSEPTASKVLALSRLYSIDCEDICSGHSLPKIYENQINTKVNELIAALCEYKDLVSK